MSAVKMKDSGVDWLGEIPRHWDVKRLKFLTREPLMYGANEAADDDTPTNPRYIRITDIEESGHLKADTFRSLPYEIAAPYLLQSGDILFARSGSVGRTFRYREDWGQVCFAGYLVKFSTDLRLAHPEFVDYFASSQPYWEWVNGISIQTTIQNVSAEKYANLFVPLPPLHEQRAIASYLDTQTSRIDALINKTEALNALLREKRVALISQAVTKGLDAGAAMKDSGVEWLGEIPSHWDVNRLRHVVQTNPKKSELRFTSPDLEVSFLPMPAVGEQGNIDLSNIKHIADVFEGYTYFCDNDVIVAKITPCFENGKGAAVRGLENGIGFGTTELFVLRPGPETASEYLYYLTVSSRFRTLGTVSMQGAAGQQRVTDLFIKDYVLALPPLHEQRAIASTLDRETARIDALSNKNDELIALLREKRSALISAAVTGKISVPSVSSVVK